MDGWTRCSSVALFVGRRTGESTASSSSVRSFVRRRNGEETKGDVDETGGGDGGEVSDESCGVDERERERE